MIPGAPTRPAVFCNPVAGTDATGPAALQEAGYLLDDLMADVGFRPQWLLDDDSQRRIALTRIAHDPGRRAVIGFALAGASGTITATPDPSGYLHVVVTVGDAVVLRAYVDRTWEEYDIWPPGADAAVGTEPPGRMGKRRTWISLSVAGWPALAVVTDGWLNLMQLDLQD